MAVNISENVLNDIAKKASFIAEAYEASNKMKNFNRAEVHSAYLQGMAYVLESIGYLFQYTDNTHIHIDTIENVENRIKGRK